MLARNRFRGILSQWKVLVTNVFAIIVLILIMSGIGILMLGAIEQELYMRDLQRVKVMAFDMPCKKNCPQTNKSYRSKYGTETYAADTDKLASR